MNDSLAPEIGSDAFPRPAPKPFHPPRNTGLSAAARWVIFALIVIGIVLSPQLLTTPVGQRGVLAASVGGMIFMLLIKSPRDGVLMTLIYLGILGGLRRWLIPAFGWAPQDPLVLVQAAVIGLYFSFVLVSRRLDWDTRLSRCLGWLLGLMVLEIVNPLQGGITVGIAGVLFMLVPVLWYYAGRRLGTPFIVLNLIRVALGLSLAGAVYGMYQIWFGYLPSEQIWIRINGVADERVFSFFTLMAEYGLFLVIGISVLWAAILKGNRAAILPLPFLIGSAFFLGERGVLVGALFSCILLWAVQGKKFRVWLPRLVFALVVGVGGLVWSLQQAQHIDFGSKAQVFVDHQTSGLLDPGHSTATAHSSMVFNGLLEGFKAPLGRGLGATSLAAARFGTGSVTTESDWSDSFVSLGLIGGLLYTFVIGRVLLTSVQQWMKTRSFVSLAILGIFLAGLGHWLHGDFYAVTMLVWFLIGAQDRAAQLDKLAQMDQAKPGEKVL